MLIWAQNSKRNVGFMYLFYQANSVNNYIVCQSLLLILILSVRREVMMLTAPLMLEDAADEGDGGDDSLLHVSI